MTELGIALTTIVSILVTAAAVLVPVVLVLKHLKNVGAARQRLLANGVPANARIMTVGPTGLTVNDAPQLQLTMEVQPPPSPNYRGGAAPFMASCSELIPLYAMGRIAPGATVPVRFDPAVPSSIAIDFRAMGFAHA